MDEQPAFIALDWGTSFLRAFLVGPDGAILARHASGHGVLNVAPGGFEAVIVATLDAWLSKHPALPVLAAGMIGSRQGWREVPYLACPAGLTELAAGLAVIPGPTGTSLRIVPGLMHDPGDGAPDVMRGEETQILGCLAATETQARLFVLPGTHSKWALAAEGKVVWFATFMTGEVYALMAQHGILGRLMEGKAEDDAAFRRGLAAAGSAGGGLLHKLFSARTLALLGRLPPTGVAAYLSGLLIGTEIAEAEAVMTALDAPPASVTVIGEARLARLYCTALDAGGIAAHLAPADVIVAGLHRIAIEAGLI
ncbi:MAG TPA: 2-dehydro-3-deoxygalactonokinase [Alphaproteobacteria bacterium]|nr:2-dehydro-3-deoxygalactonokinase [Alphaproteobacteria bacterium]